MAESRRDRRDIDNTKTGIQEMLDKKPVQQSSNRENIEDVKIAMRELREEDRNREEEA